MSSPMTAVSCSWLESKALGETKKAAQLSTLAFCGVLREYCGVLGRIERTTPLGGANLSLVSDARATRRRNSLSEKGPNPERTERARLTFGKSKRLNKRCSNPQTTVAKLRHRNGSGDSLVKPMR
jgi:hypothetical protein